jgi:hypothetical protein
MMKTILFILLGIIGHVVLGNELSLESIKRESEIKIVHTAHEGIRLFIKSIDGKEKAINHTEFTAICSKGCIKIKKSYFTGKDDTIFKEENGTTREYISLWKDLLNIGLEDLDSLPMDEAVDPFEFIDSWRIDQDTFNFHFKAENRMISFNLYDIDSYRDKRFKMILNRMMFFFGE